MEHPSQVENTRTLVRWTDSEVTAIAEAFIAQREADAIGNPIEMLRRAIQNCVDARTARFRDINTWLAVPDVKERVDTLWLEKMANQNPAPVIVHVETQSPPDYVDILHRCDLPSLCALVVAKLSEQAASLKPLLTVLNGANTSSGAPLQAPVSLLNAASAKPRKTRVLIVGPLNAQFREIEQQAAQAKIPVELLYLDKDKPKNGVPISTDYVIGNEFIQHSLEANLKRAVPAGRYFYLASGGIGAIVNKLRDIATLLPPRA